ncbi:diguanylate cyclase [Lichenibacterium minor]|jgi:diguanylate cyclase (GGDEF)-like protein|uniref:diguanylate cyclase n=1 Tax=Lichenibacterium minor TaxID=2316528 RepID=A0A4Q2U107_9HYPH|nr:sensor domain-containing diguanylate cyclase [Lichenibacterium minor]RYC29760.1 diguanylate cyclase [Lichenibacterium minor]
MSSDSDDELSNLMQFLYTCPVGLVDFDASGTIGLMNPKAMQLMQVLTATPHVSNFFSAFERCGPELRNLAQGFTGRRGTVCENRRVFVREGIVDDASGATVLDCTMVKLSDERFIATLSDVSRQVAQERRLRQAEVWFSSLLDGADDFDVLSLDGAGRIDGVKAGLLEETGLPRDAVIGRTLDVFDCPDADGAASDVVGKIALARRDGWYLDEGWRRVKGGERRWCQRLIVVKSDRDRDSGERSLERAASGYVAVLRSTTRQTFDAAKLRRLLQTDHLTGACNRAHFFEVAERELRQGPYRGQVLSVVAMDVDHFKRINDTHGHAVGDEVLKAITAACQGVLDPADTFARLGGEEFVAMVATDLAGASAKAEALRARVAALEIPSAAGPLRVTASFGCATVSASVRSMAALLAEADRALYSAKHAGRNRVGIAEGVAAVA